MNGLSEVVMRRFIPSSIVLILFKVFFFLRLLFILLTLVCRNKSRWWWCFFFSSFWLRIHPQTIFWLKTTTTTMKTPCPPLRRLTEDKKCFYEERVKTIKLSKLPRRLSLKNRFSSEREGERERFEETQRSQLAMNQQQQKGPQK